MADGAYQVALRMLARRDHFRAELEGKLRRRGFAPAEVDAALVRCDALGLIDDDGLAGRFAEVRATENGWGPRRIEAELRRRGSTGRGCGRPSPPRCAGPSCARRLAGGGFPSVGRGW